MVREPGRELPSGTILGHGDVPVEQCLRILARAGYCGAVSIEFEGIEEPLAAIRMGLDCLRKSICREDKTEG